MRIVRRAAGVNATQYLMAIFYVVNVFFGELCRMRDSSRVAGKTVGSHGANLPKTEHLSDSSYTYYESYQLINQSNLFHHKDIDIK